MRWGRLWRFWKVVVHEGGCAWKGLCMKECGGEGYKTKGMTRDLGWRRNRCRILRDYGIVSHGNVGSGPW